MAEIAYADAILVLRAVVAWQKTKDIQKLIEVKDLIILAQQVLSAIPNNGYPLSTPARLGIFVLNYFGEHACVPDPSSFNTILIDDSSYTLEFSQNSGNHEILEGKAGANACDFVATLNSSAIAQDALFFEDRPAGTSDSAAQAPQKLSLDFKSFKWTGNSDKLHLHGADGIIQIWKDGTALFYPTLEDEVQKQKTLVKTGEKLQSYDGKEVVKPVFKYYFFNRKPKYTINLDGEFLRKYEGLASCMSALKAEGDWSKINSIIGYTPENQ